MNKAFKFVVFFPVLFSVLRTSPAHADKAVVRAILFYSPSCGHCHYVITEVLPGLFEQYGDQLYIVGVDVSQIGGRELFLSTLQYFDLESAGVPFLVVGDAYLIGSRDIPEQFPGLIEHHLAQGGVDFPAIPGLLEALAASPPEQAPSPTPEAMLDITSIAATSVQTQTPSAAPPAQESPIASPTATVTPGLWLTAGMSSSPAERFARDPLGNSLSVLVLVGMLLSIGGAAVFFRRPAADFKPWGWAIPVLCLIGLGVAGYLAYVETAQVEAFCGPVGDCNTVQQSQYARLFGILPIGILGIIGYGMILLAWALGSISAGATSAYAHLALLGMTAFGVLFSIYLTFLEPFVIGATCAWCLTSAVLMTILFWLSLAPGKAAWNVLRRK